MCGIAGIYNFEPTDGKLPENIKEMAKTIKHRGPDDEGIFVEGNLALGHRRLSILDLTKAGHQPMIYGKQDLIIVFNGEIYNYIEIREHLMKRGYKFKSKTDTEVILASYKEWGTNCLSRFNGMWAFAIYDFKKSLLFAARDRLGVKPFYYYNKKNTFLFGSEIKAILAHSEIEALPNDKIIWDYLIGGVIDHSEDTFFKGIKELRGGHYLILEPKTRNLKIKKYWDLGQNNISITEEEAERKFSDLFLDSVKLRLRSDVPLGTCLSGGLDSSAIVCTVNNLLKTLKNIPQLGKWQQTFSACYDDKKYPGCDERKFIREVVKKTKVRSHLIFPQGNKLAKEIEKIIWHQDSPFISSSIYAQWNVFRLSKQHKVKVILDGQGADELLAGYLPFFSIYFLELIRKFKLGLMIKEIISYSRYHPGSIWSILKNLGYIIAGKGFFGKSVGKIYRRKLFDFKVFSPDFLEKYQPNYVLNPTKNIFKNALYTQLVKTGLPALLRYEDRDSMAFSIESRVPFLDYRLVEFIYSLKDEQKLKNGQTKWVMRQALRNLLPKKVQSRQDKIGFNTPEEIWFHNELKKEMNKIFSSKSLNLRSYFNKGEVQKLFEAYLRGETKNFSLLWRIYNLEIWFRVFIDNPSKNYSVKRSS